MAPHRQRAPAVDFPPSPTPRVHHTSVLDSPVQPAPVHELSRIFAAVSLHSTADNESATSTPDIRSPLKFRQRPGPRKKGAAEAPRWIPPPIATPSRVKNQGTPLRSPSVTEPTMARELEKSIRIRESRRRSGKWRFAVKSNTSNALRQRTKGPHLGTPDRGPRYDENSAVVIAKLELFWGGSGYTLPPWSRDYLLASRHPR